MKIVEDYSIYVDQSVMPTSGKEWIPYKFAMPAELMKVYDDMRTDMSEIEKYYNDSRHGRSDAG